MSWRVVARRAAQLAGLFLAIHFLLPVVGGFRTSMTVLAQTNLAVLVLAVLVQLGSLVAYAQCTRALLPAGDGLGLLQAFWIQLAMLATTHVVPGGPAASMPLGYRLFRRSGVSAGNAGFVLGLQGVGSAAVLNALLVVVLVGSAPFRAWRSTDLAALVWGIVLVGGLFLVVDSLADEPGWLRRVRGAVVRHVPTRYRRSLGTARRDIAADFARLRADHRAAVRAAGWAGLQWLLDFASLWLILAAVGSRVRPDALFVAFGLSQLTTFLPITPGGLGVFEAVLTSALLDIGVPRSTAVVSVLAYRLAEFWLPIPLGALGLGWLSITSRRDRLRSPDLGPG